MGGIAEEGPGALGDSSILWGAANREVAVVAEVITDASGERDASDGDIDESNVASDRLSGGGGENAGVSASLSRPGPLTALAHAALVNVRTSAADEGTSDAADTQRNSLPPDTTLSMEEESQTGTISRAELPRSSKMRLIEPTPSPLSSEANAKQHQADTADTRVSGSPPPASTAQSTNLGNTALAVVVDTALETPRDSTQLRRRSPPAQFLAAQEAPIQKNQSQHTVIEIGDDDGECSPQPPGSAGQHNNSSETLQPSITHTDTPEYQPVPAVEFAPPTRIESSPSQAMASAVNPHRQARRIARHAPAGAPPRPAAHNAPKPLGIGHPLFASSPQAPRQHCRLSTPAQRQPEQNPLANRWRLLSEVHLPPLEHISSSLPQQQPQPIQQPLYRRLPQPFAIASSPRGIPIAPSQGNVVQATSRSNHDDKAVPSLASPPQSHNGDDQFPNTEFVVPSP